MPHRRRGPPPPSASRSVCPASRGTRAGRTMRGTRAGRTMRGTRAGIEAARQAHGKGMQSYLIMMAVRLIEMHRTMRGTRADRECGTGA